MCDTNGINDVDANPKAERMLQIEQHNTTCCDILLGEGYDGDRLWKVFLPNNIGGKKPILSITKPLSEEHLDLLRKASTAGKHFHATGGMHLNSEAFFIAKAKETRDEEIKELRQEKRQVTIMFDLQTEAKKMMTEK